MPYLDQLFAPAQAPAFQAAQCWEGTVVSTDPTYVVMESFSRTQRWGPCQPAGAAVAVGDRVSVAMSQQGVLWLLGGAGGGTGGDSGGGGNVDGGFPDSVYGGLPLVDGNGVTR